MQRIHGTAFFTAGRLDAHLKRLEEAKLRDHRKIGREMDLFSFHAEAPGRRLLAPEGHGPLERARRVPPRRAAEARLRRGAHPDGPVRRALEAVRPLGPLQGQHVLPRDRRALLRRQADELPRHLPRVRQPRRSRTATCRCASPSSATSTGTSCRACSWARCALRTFTQDDAHVYCAPRADLEREIADMIDMVQTVYPAHRLRHGQVACASRPGPANRMGGARDLGPRRGARSRTRCARSGLAFA